MSEYMPHNCEWNIWIAEHGKQIRAEVIDDILAICHHAYSVVDVVDVLKKLKEHTNDNK